MQFSGAVLAGGQSRRFGHDKARHVFRGKALMQWVLEGLSPAAERFIVANRAYPEFNLAVYPDLLHSSDILSGLHSALYRAQQDWVAVAACDQPFLSAAYWQFMQGQVSPECLAIVPYHSEGFYEPLGALYHKSLEPLLRSKIQSGSLKIQSLFDEIPILSISATDLISHFGTELFLNANRLEDLPP